jgi:RHS repeat-associated protein
LRIDDTGTVSIEFANPHGDIVATAAVGLSGVDSYTESDEYGQASNPTRAQPRYGWLGAKQRDTGSVLAGLTLMGARLYNPVTGRFLSIDPVAGGNDNRYTYPTDPIYSRDTSGRQKEDWWHRVQRHLREARACGSYCGIAGLISREALRLVASESNRGNAVRHFTWQVTLSFFLGVGMARRIGNAHDWDLLRFDGGADSARDLANNKISRRWYRRNVIYLISAWSLARKASSSSLGRLRYFMATVKFIGNGLYDEGGFKRI